jgi:hypothetical protein
MANENHFGVTASSDYFTTRDGHRRPDSAKIANQNMFDAFRAKRGHATLPTLDALLASIEEKNDIQFDRSRITPGARMEFDRAIHGAWQRNPGDYDPADAFRAFVDRYVREYGRGVPSMGAATRHTPSAMRHSPAAMSGETAREIRVMLAGKKTTLPKTFYERLENSRALRESVRHEFITAAGGLDRAIVWLSHSSRGKSKMKQEQARERLLSQNPKMMVQVLMTLCTNKEVKAELQEKLLDAPKATSPQKRASKETKQRQSAAR